MLPLLLAVATGFVQGPPWAHFSRERYLAHTRDMVEIGSGRQSAGVPFHHVMRLTRTRLGAKPTILWADSMTCQAMAPIIAGMTGIAVPRPAPYGVPGKVQMIVTDGSGYDLDAPSNDIMGRIAISSNEGSPLSHWVDDALQQLTDCWSIAAGVS